VIDKPSAPPSSGWSWWRPTPARGSSVSWSRVSALPHLACAIVVHGRELEDAW